MKTCAEISEIPAKMKNRIDGFMGYIDPQHRVKSDKQFRAYILKQNRQLLKTLNNITISENAASPQEVQENIAAAIRNLLIISESLRRPTYRDSLFFKKLVLPAEIINKIHKLECMMLEEVTNIGVEINTIIVPNIEQQDIKDHFIFIQDFMDNINQFLFEREALILGEEEY